MTKCIWEHFIEHPRHIEFQILADGDGNVVHLGKGIVPSREIIRK